MKKLLVFLFFAITTYANAQYFQTGQDPASIKWRQINTENFQLIYPDYYEEQAQILAQKLEMVYKVGGKSLKYKPQKISVILHTQTVRSNGLVAYAPKRSEFYSTPHQGIYPQDWLEQLATHEFRHIVQIDKLNNELPKLIKVLLGEQGTAMFFGAYLPWWFIEGDAVVTETALGKCGRGRFPSFLVEHIAQVVEHGKYSYDKAYLGSFKNFVPNHYRLGYYMVGNTRQRYGSDVWEKTIKRVGQKPLSLTPFNKALKLETGMNKVRLYDSIFDSLTVVWNKEDANYKSENSLQFSKENKVYSNYTYSHWLNDETLIAYRTALNKVPAFVKVNSDGREEKLFTPGFIFDESVSYMNEWIVWAEQIPDLRWSHSGKSRIKLFNITTRKQVSLFPDYKAFAPAISNDLKKVVVVETDFSNKNYLSVYAVANNQLISRFQTVNNNYFFSPVWKNSNEIICVELTPNGKRIIQVDLSKEIHKVLINKDMGDIKHLRLADNTLYFISSFSGKNALYKFGLKNQELSQVYAPRFDVAYPAISEEGKIALSDYTGNGFRLVQISEENSMEIDKVKKADYLLANTMAAQEPGVVNFELIDSLKYKSKHYSKSKNLFNFHSWAPIFIDAYQQEFQPGASLMSQNKLGTALTTLGYRWDTSEKTGQFYARYTYSGWYPVFDIEFSAGKRSADYWQITEYRDSYGEVERRDTSLQQFKWNETKLSADIRLPLNLTQGVYYRYLQPEIKYELTHMGEDKSTIDNFTTGYFNSLTYRLYYHQLRRQSQQDVYPNFGFAIDASYKHSPQQSSEMGNLVGGTLTTYLPGLLPNHGFLTYAGVQEKKLGNTFHFSDVVRFPRGWGRIESKNLRTLMLNYKLPLINPDLSIGGISYIRRISTTLFADYANIQGTYYNGEEISKFDTDLSSYGVELLGDVNFFRYYAPVKIGVRASYLNEIDDFAFDFLFSIDFTSL